MTTDAATAAAGGDMATQVIARLAALEQFAASQQPLQAAIDDLRAVLRAQ